MKTGIMKLLSMVLAVSMSMVLSAFAGEQARNTHKDPSIAILFTNDVHSYYNRDIGYDGLVLMKKELEQQYDHVVLVDAGDAVQGAPLGSLSRGKEPIRLMNEAGYDIAVIGNHEFDYGLDILEDLREQLGCSYICTNFRTADGEPVFDPYRILTCGDTRVAFIGVDTPTVYGKSELHNLIDDQGTPMYDLKSDESGELLYECIQNTIDEVRKQDADHVILVAHLGNGDDMPPAFMSKAVVSHLTGLDAVIDGHSHEVYNIMAEDADGKEIPIVQTGCYFQNVGTMILHPDGTITAQLYDEIPAPEEWMEGIEAVKVTRGEKERFVDAQMHKFLEDITDSYAEVMNRKIGEAAFDMIIQTEDGGSESRKSENNLCELVVDAFRESCDTDISFLCAGSIRNNLPAGEITFNTVLNVLPYSNDVQVAEIDGKTLLDALEFGSRLMPEINSGFLQVSGLEYTIDLSIESPVVTDEKGTYQEIEGERRVKDVMIDGEPLDPETIYTVATSSYLLAGSDNYSMLPDNVEIIEETGKTDNMVLADYIEHNLNGVIPDTYQDPGNRIHIIGG